MQIDAQFPGGTRSVASASLDDGRNNTPKHPAFRVSTSLPLRSLTHFSFPYRIGLSIGKLRPSGREVTHPARAAEWNG